MFEEMFLPYYKFSVIILLFYSILWLMFQLTYDIIYIIKNWWKNGKNN